MYLLCVSFQHHFEQMHYSTMFSLSYFTIIFLVILLVASGDFLPSSTTSDFSFVGPIIKLPSGPNPVPDPNLYPKPNPGSECKPDSEYVPQNVVIPQSNPTSGRIFANDPSVTLFMNIFLDMVYGTDILREVFDLSELPPKQHGDLVRQYTEKALLKIGVEKAIAAAVGEFAGRAIPDNFDVFTLGIVSTAYGNMASNFLFVDGDLELHNAEYLALLFAQSFIDSAKVTMNSDPTSKFQALADGFVNFYVSLGLFTTTKAPIIGFYVGNEWFNAAVNYRWL